MQSLSPAEKMRVLGQPGDLADAIVAILSLVARKEGTVKVSTPDFYRFFFQISREFPDQFPPLGFEHTGRYVYSKMLGQAMEYAFRLGVEVMNPRFLYLGISHREDAARNLGLIEENAGNQFIERLQPVAERFSELVQGGCCAHA